MNPIRTVFFGSTSDSVLVLAKLHKSRIPNYELRITTLVTQPPRPIGRKQIITPTPTELWAKENSLTVLSFPSNKDKPWLYENNQTVIDTLSSLKPDLIVSASYGQKIPTETLKKAKFGGINVHPSLLPRWRGGDPVPWAILSGDHLIGVSIITLGEKLDDGLVLVQKKIPITSKDLSNPLRSRLFAIGADLLVESLPDFLSGKIKGVPQDTTKITTAKRLTRDAGLESWDNLKKAMENSEEANRIDRKFRAFHPWPGLWTEIPVNDSKHVAQIKRLKILSLHLQPTTHNLIIDHVQLEGKTPVTFSQFSSAYLGNQVTN